MKVPNRNMKNAPMGIVNPVAKAAKKLGIEVCEIKKIDGAPTGIFNLYDKSSSFQLSKSLLNSVVLQVKAAEIANEGITTEYESGLGRSTLDVIQSNSILLTSQISLVESERNYLLSQFKLLQSVGLLKNDYLKLQ